MDNENFKNKYTMQYKDTAKEFQKEIDKFKVIIKKELEESKKKLDKNILSPSNYDLIVIGEMKKFHSHKLDFSSIYGKSIIDLSNLWSSTKLSIEPIKMQKFFDDIKGVIGKRLILDTSDIEYSKGSFSIYGYKLMTEKEALSIQCKLSVATAAAETLIENDVYIKGRDRENKNVKETIDAHIYTAFRAISCIQIELYLSNEITSSALLKLVLNQCKRD